MASITEAFSGARLRDIRERAGLYQHDIAARLKDRGIPAHQSVVSQWENGRQAPMVGTLKALAEVLDVTVDDLLDTDTAGAA